MGVVMPAVEVCSSRVTDRLLPVLAACSQGRCLGSSTEVRSDRHRADNIELDTGGICGSHSACNFAGARRGYPVVRSQHRHDPDRHARRSCRHRRREESGREAGPQCPQAAGRTACPGTAADDSCAAGAAGSGGSVDASGTAAQPVCAAAAGRPRDTLASGCADQAGPVATDGPSAAPHSVHEPSYSAGFSTPRR